MRACWHTPCACHFQAFGAGGRRGAEGRPGSARAPIGLDEVSATGSATAKRGLNNTGQDLLRRTRIMRHWPHGKRADRNQVGLVPQGVVTTRECLLSQGLWRRAFATFAGLGSHVLRVPQAGPPSFSQRQPATRRILLLCMRFEGGDLIDFVRLRDGLSFRAAAAALGALSEDFKQPRGELARTKREQERARDAAQALRDEERRLRLELRGEIHSYERILCDAGEYLGGPDSETEWGLLASAQDLLRCAVAGYMVLAFGSQRAREEYVRDFDRRGKIESAVLLQGFVVDDYGHRVEVA